MSQFHWMTMATWYWTKHHSAASWIPKYSCGISLKPISWFPLSRNCSGVSIGLLAENLNQELEICLCLNSNHWEREVCTRKVHTFLNRIFFIIIICAPSLSKQETMSYRWGVFWYHFNSAKTVATIRAMEQQLFHSPLSSILFHKGTYRSYPHFPCQFPARWLPNK